MQYRTLGKTGLRVSEIGFGGWAIGGPMRLGRIPVGWSGVSEGASLKAIAQAIDDGINFFDTADIYGVGLSERLIGEAVRSRREQIILATKGGRLATDGAGPHEDFSRAHMTAAVEGSLRRLQTDVIDLYLLHNPSKEEIERGEACDALEDLQRAGKIRFYGASISRPEEGLAWIARGRGPVLQVLFNVLNQAPAQTLFPRAQAENIGVIARVPLASGLLTGKITAGTLFNEEDNRRNYLTTRRLPDLSRQMAAIQELLRPYGITMVHAALRFVLAEPAVAVTIPGAKDARQVAENAAASGEALPEPLRAELKRRWLAYDFYLRYRIPV